MQDKHILKTLKLAKLNSRKNLNLKLIHFSLNGQFHSGEPCLQGLLSLFYINEHYSGDKIYEFQILEKESTMPLASVRISTSGEIYIITSKDRELNA